MHQKIAVNQITLIGNDILRLQRSKSYQPQNVKNNGCQAFNILITKCYL